MTDLRDVSLHRMRRFDGLLRGCTSVGAGGAGWAKASESWVAVCEVQRVGVGSLLMAAARVELDATALAGRSDSIAHARRRAGEQILAMSRQHSGRFAIRPIYVGTDI